VKDLYDLKRNQSVALCFKIATDAVREKRAGYADISTGRQAPQVTRLKGK
jgi:hypothetical protein